MINVITVHANIGAGKSVFGELICPQIGLEFVSEPFEEVKSLELYYKDPKRWSFTTQIEFFIKRAYIHFKLIKENIDHKAMCLERDPHVDRFVFGQIGYDLGYMNETEWNTYLDFYNKYGFKDLLIIPDGIIYLRASVETLINHIEKRNREMEVKDSILDKDYLLRLNILHDNWLLEPNFNINNKIVPVVTINMDKVDFENNLEDKEKVIKYLNNWLDEILWKDRLLR